MKRSNRTKQDLASSLKLLMRTSCLSDISVQYIVDSSGISRHTFYYHFIDKQDLVQWVFRSEVVEPMEKETEHYFEKLIGVMERMQKEPAFYARALEVNGQNSFSEYFFDTLLHMAESSLREFAQSRSRDLPEERCAFAARFVTYAVVGIIKEWVKTGMKEEPQQVMGMLLGLSEGLAELVFEQPQED